MHIKYPKIHRLGKDEVEGILDYPVTVQEKIDGANASMWLEEADNDSVLEKVRFGTRNNKVEDFRGLKSYFDRNDGLQYILIENPNYRLFGEWLVKHTISYNEGAYKHFYLFDILDESKNEWLDPLEVARLADEYRINRPIIFGQGIFSEKSLKDNLGQSCLGPKGEGIVIKSTQFVNKFGDNVYAKMVTPQFTEENAITFGGNNKHSEAYYEQKIVNKYMTLGRVKKIIQKIESQEDRKLDKPDTPRVSQTVYHDMLEEEIWSIQKEVPKVDFKKLKNIATKKAVKIFHDVLEGSDEVSVAYTE